MANPAVCPACGDHRQGLPGRLTLWEGDRYFVIGECYNPWHQITRAPPEASVAPTSPPAG